MKQFFALCALLASFSASAQSTYERVLLAPGDPQYVQHFSSAVAPDGKIVVLDQLYAGYAVTLFDDSLHQLWSRKIKRGSDLTSFVPMCICFMVNGDIMLNGFVNTWNTYQSNGWNAGLMRLDQNGNVLWDRMYHPAEHWQTQYELPAVALSMPNGGITLITWKQGWAVNDSESISLMRIDDSGNVLWAKSLFAVPNDAVSFPVADLDQSGNIVISDGGSFFRITDNGSVLLSINLPVYPLVGTSYLGSGRVKAMADGGMVFAYSTAAAPSVLRLDSTGTALWFKRYSYGDYYNPWISGISEMTNGDLLFHPTSGQGNTLALRVDANGQPIAHFDLPENYHILSGSYIYNYHGNNSTMFGSADSSYHYLFDMLYPINGGVSPPITGLLKLDSTLLLPCGGSNAPFTAMDLGPLPIGTAGTTVTIDSVHSWTFKYELDTAIYTTVDACTFLLGLQESMKTEAMSVYPSPVTAGNAAMLSLGNVDVVTRIECVSADGRMMSAINTRPHQQQVDISANGFAPGLYLLRAIDADQHVRGTCRLMVE